MSKKDRIAIVISVIYFFILPLPKGLEGDIKGLVLFLPILAYWGYRFIKNDISFLNVNERD